MKYVLYLLIAFIVIWLVLWLIALKETRKAEREAFPRGEIIRVNGHAMHVVTTGAAQGTAPDLVLIHGSNGHSRDMTFRLAGLLAADYRVYIIDRPGLGYSEAMDPKGDTITAQARQIADAATAAGAQKPIVMGHSYGGAVALAWAVHMPERISALVPVASASHPWDTPLDPLYKWGSSPLGPLFLPLLPAVVTEARMERILEGVFEPDSVPEGYFDWFVPKLSLRYASMLATAHQRAGLLDEIKALVPLYGQIAVPTEIVHGTEDITVGLSIHSEPLARAVPGAQLTALEGHGHMIQHSATEDIAAAIHRAAARAGLRNLR